MINQFRSHENPFVKLNLSLGLIGQRIAVQESAAWIRQLLMTDRDKWSQKKEGLFSLVINKSSKKSEDPLTTPEGENQIVQLKMLSLLALLKDPHAQDAIRNYLDEQTSIANSLTIASGFW